MKKFLELKLEMTDEPVLIELSSIILVMPANKKCSRIFCQGTERSISARITYPELVAKLTALGVCEVV